MPRLATTKPTHFYPTYFFRANEQDPIIDQMQTIMEDAGHKQSKLHELTGLSTSTFHNWFVKRKTRRPNYTSVAAFARGCGYEVALIKSTHKLNGQWKASPPPIITRYRSAAPA